jgi:L-alanine-DL-glutamate epimerase-like enolase superfamily enzyme
VADLDCSLRLARLDVHVLRYPIDTPVRTSFGVMTDRPAVLVRAVDHDGTSGWGEVWCNFPACGAEHRGRLVETVVAPLATAGAFASPQACFAHLQAATAVLALQTGEHGPIAQAIAGVDLALWDLVARRAGLPLWRVLGGTSDAIGVYASGINPDAPEQVVARERAQGHRAFKLKIGFGRERDLGNLERLRAQMRPGEALMVDANQAWDLDQAREMLAAMAAARNGAAAAPVPAPHGEAS